MKLSEIQDLIKFVAKSGVSEVELETKEVKIVIKTPAGKKNEPVYVQAPPVTQQITTAPQQVIAQPQQNQASENKTPVAPPAANDESKLLTIKSPMIGTFYRASGPDKPLFASVGDEITPGKTVCIIEA